ncbi:immunity 52 family protein [Myxococcus sp. K15C18031901]|uniref:immunity 52 family protein n=1 Tax=Myxococcus dinghuensis TaxID=2906761 RepID=UPI0020A79286|nr:immunity 52 family protein [Myxococcus dinghuensis]MCP3098409.1 immunity 52 family protein [Myxococcus dinghuensis]
MIEKYYAGVYWSGRREPVEEYARRAEALFQGLALQDLALSRWFEQSTSPAEALAHGFVPDLATLIGLLGTKRYQQGGGDVSFAAWNGLVEGNSVASISCGSRSRYVVDRCVLTLPPDSPVAECLVTSLALSQVVRVMALAWDPEWGVATSTIHRDSSSESADPGTFVGWVTYFAQHRGTVPPLPAPVRVEPVGDKGTLIVLTPERFTASNPEHVALAERVRELLDRAGLLNPLQGPP